jgi:hypothetical protein
MTSGEALEIVTREEKEYLKTNARQVIGTLFVTTPYNEQEGITVYLLLRGDFLNRKDDH